MEIGAHLFINQKNKGFLGRGRVELLKKIDELGSISKAAKALGMSYKKAWDNIDAMNSVAPKPIVETQTGGRGGGGARLTPYAKELIARYEELARRINEAATMEESPALQLSARNRVRVRIKKIKRKNFDALITGEFDGGKLKALITIEALEELGLHEGDEALFLFKAGAPGAKGENCLKGMLIEHIDDRRLRVQAGSTIFTISGKFKLKGYAVQFCVDPEDIIVAKV